MTALKGEAISRFIKRPDKPVVLIYGPDTGLVSERAGSVIDAFLGDDADAMAKSVIDGDSLPSAPERLAEEAHSVPMFGGRRAIRVSASARNIMPAVDPLLSDPPGEAIVVLEAGDLKPTSPLRKAIEKADSAVAIPCYVDDARAIETLIAEEMAGAGLQISSDARAALMQLLGGDRRATRGELKKLATYCHGRERVEIDDVAAVVGDASALELGVLIDSVALGDAAQADLILRRSLAAGTTPGSIVSALARHFMQLSEARLKIDRGATADAAMRELRPPVFFKRQNGFRRQLGLWSPESLGRALDLIAAAEAEVRLKPDLAEALTGRALITLAGAARQSR
jgi:DNA polymerase-3 subunit delta